MKASSGHFTEWSGPFTQGRFAENLGNSATFIILFPCSLLFQPSPVPPLKMKPRKHFRSCFPTIFSLVQIKSYKNSKKKLSPSIVLKDTKIRKLR